MSFNLKKNIIIMIFLISGFYAFSYENKYYLDFNTSDFEPSSFLTEGSTKYSAECLSSNDELPWVPKDSKNASIIIKNCDTKDIIISSGYVKKDKPDLYEKNARPKTILIEYLQSKKSKTVTLKDTSEPQTINIFSPTQASETIKLTFTENYKGSKYSDLCINYICKPVHKRESTSSVSDYASFDYYFSDISTVESFYDKNVKIIAGGKTFLIYNNNDFPEIRVDNFIVDFDITISYPEGIMIVPKSATEIEVSLMCAGERQTFLFNPNTFKATAIK